MMSERKWTPGPWVAEPENYDGDGGVLVRVGGDYPRNCIANAWGQKSAKEVDDEGQANAHLIASAPDLYDALQAMVDYCNAECGSKIYPGHQANAALAKARGETQ